jgi:hypothetical protein
LTYNFLCSIVVLQTLVCCFDIYFILFFRKAAGLFDLDLEPWMVGRYLDGSRPVHASDLLEDASGRVLRQRESLAVRDSMCLQLVLQNAKRGGDVTHIRAEDLEGYGELTVSMQC